MIQALFIFHLLIKWNFTLMICMVSCYIRPRDIERSQRNVSSPFYVSPWRQSYSPPILPPEDNCLKPEWHVYLFDWAPRLPFDQSISGDIW